ncbi:zinc dependent phospholipase C family protein [Pontibacter anaerobius]|uniref:Zinc dependent phospholipase C family protein n=1 Tax=Pontibacter anaerobius TaxID=2993940 RepID=A0ABT3RIV4_9BACT|nr:zinc dependent phospholipase C family protein [Pontibacter anaerobius]MCX2741298.1 zinc dependent phospholipase C family protein [Pontibacter anaerobius]
MKLKLHTGILCLILLAATLLPALPARAYSVLTHQAVVDAVWDTRLKPLLLLRYPNASEEELKNAHAHAYGGSIVQDMGYYPFGNTFFTDLTHYVRSGDFVESLVRHADTVEELGFALGAMAHFSADIYGHPIGTNKAVPLVYPKVQQEHGHTVTYAEDAISHIKTEFGFDVLQVARGNYAPEAYKDFIGFEVAKELLKEAFLETYGLELNNVFMSLPVAIGSYRYTIRGIFPDLTKAAWQAKKGEIQEASPDITRRQFMYRMSRASFHEQFGRDYDRPNFFARAVAWVIKVLPKVGPLRPLAFVPPPPKAEELYMESFNMTVDKYGAMLQQMGKHHTPRLQNMQLDTGEPTYPGTYPLTDETYAELLKKLAKAEFKQADKALQQNILLYFEQAKAPDRSDKEALKEWEETQEYLVQLQRLHAGR